MSSALSNPVLCVTKYKVLNRAELRDAKGRVSGIASYVIYSMLCVTLKK